MRALRRFCRPSYDMRIGFALAGGPVARTAGFAAVWQCGCTAVHAARGRRLTWLTAVHGGGRPCFRRRAAAWERRAFLFRCVLAVFAKENAGSYASGALSAAPADKAAFRTAFARELRCGRRALRSGAMSLRMERRAGFAAGLSDGGGRAFGRAEANRRQSAGLRI